MLDLKAGARCNRIENIKIMKLTVFLVFVCCAGFLSYVIADPSSASGPGAQIAPLDNAVVTPVKVPINVAPGSSVRDSAAGSSDQFRQATAPNASATGQNPFANPYSNGFLNQNTTAASNVIGRGQEKVVEISDKDRAAEAAAKSEKSEITKKFETSILNQGLDEIANSKASSKVPDFAPINPVNGATIPPRPASSAAPISPIPSATVSTRP
jgi:hypothetical protein